MSSFTDKLELRDFSKNEFYTLKEFTYYVGSEDSDDFIVVPKGFVTDGASIPKWCWPIVGHPFAEFRQAAVLHDYLYRNHIRTKKQADKIFLEAMEVLGVDEWKRNVMYWAVCIGGTKSWKRGPAKYNQVQDEKN